MYDILKRVEALINQYDEEVDRLYDLLKNESILKDPDLVNSINVEIDTLEGVISDLYKVF